MKMAGSWFAGLDGIPPRMWGREAEQWSFLLEGGAGTWLALGNRFQVAMALQAQLAEPYPTVRFSGAVA